MKRKLRNSILRILLKQYPDLVIPASCNIVSIFYAGDEGGIVRGLDIDGRDATAHVVSITHLGFDRRMPLSRQIEVYQRHRIKKLKQHGRKLSSVPVKVE